MNRIVMIVVCALAFVLLSAACGGGSDKDVLITLYESTDGDDWEINTNWLTDKPIEEWRGVVTNDAGEVIGLNLDNNQLSGEIPPELGNLSNLKVMRLGGYQLSIRLRNQLSGEIPPELGNLRNLERLGLEGNQLSGEIPPELGNLRNLWLLTLDINQLSGEIPPELGKLTNLGRLELGGNQLSGEIPSELGNLRNLKWLGLGGNQLSGCIPSNLRGADIKADPHLSFCK